MTDRELAEELADKITRFSLPIIAQGLLNREAMRSNAKVNLDTPPDELPDKERRKQFGLRVKMMRSLNGMTQPQLAEKLGVTVQAVSSYETGKTEPTVKILISLARALHVSADWLLDITPPQEN